MKRFSMTVLALGVAMGTAPANAQMFTKGQLASSVVAASGVASLAVLTAPVWLTLGASKKLHDHSASGGFAGVGGAGMKAGPLPPLTVEKVVAQADGAVDVTLMNPDSPTELAVVQWPARENNPGTTLQVGDVLDLTPTEVGSGWTVANAEGVALAFLPTAHAARNQMSERW